MKLDNLRIRTLLLIGFGTILAAMLVLVGLGIGQMNKMLYEGRAKDAELLSWRLIAASEQMCLDSTWRTAWPLTGLKERGRKAEEVRAAPRERRPTGPEAHPAAACVSASERVCV